MISLITLEVRQIMNQTSPTQEAVRLKVYRAGPVSVVGFGGRPIKTRIDFGSYQASLTDLIKRAGCRVLAIDLTGVEVAPARMLGVLVALRKLVDRIEIHNAAGSTRETLAMIQTASLFDLRS
jgi:hypothetical protein